MYWRIYGSLLYKGKAFNKRAYIFKVYKWWNINIFLYSKEKSQIRLHQNGRLLNGIRNIGKIKSNKNTENIWNISNNQMNLNTNKYINLISTKKETKKKYWYIFAKKQQI